MPYMSACVKLMAALAPCWQDEVFTPRGGNSPIHIPTVEMCFWVCPRYFERPLKYLNGSFP